MKQIPLARFAGWFAVTGILAAQPYINARGVVNTASFAAPSALPVYVSASQIQAIMPSNAPLGRVSVHISNQGSISNPAPFTVVSSNFGIFTWNALDVSNPNSSAIFVASSFGSGPAFAHNDDFDTGGAQNSTAQPAMPEQEVTLWGTGLGPNIGSDSILPYPADLPVPVEVFVGGVPATVTATRRSSHPRHR